MKRLRNKNTSPTDVKGQLWLIDGGPGGTGAEFSSFVDMISRAMGSDFDLIIPTHRGTGHSNPLWCPGYTNNANKTCAAHLKKTFGEKLNAFSSQNAAKDIGMILPQMRNANRSQWIYGFSYGSYLTLRYLVLYPDQVDGAIVDGVPFFQRPPVYTLRSPFLLQNFPE